MKNFRVTDKDLYEFNAWIKGRLQDTPRLMQYFDKEKDYEEYMIDYQDSHLNLDNDPAVIDKNYAMTNDQYMKEAIRLIKIRDKKISDEEAKELADFGLGLAFKPQDFIDVLKDTLKKEGKRFSETEGVKCDWPDGVYQVSYDDFMVVNSIDNQMKLTYETEEFGDEEFNGTLTVKDGIAKLVKNAVQSYSTRHTSLWNHCYDILINQNWSSERATEFLDKCDTKALHKIYDTDGRALQWDNARLKMYFPHMFSEREKVSAEMLEKAKNEGVVQKKPNGAWGIISIEAGEWWIPDYDSKDDAENALKAYHANKGFSDKMQEITFRTTNPELLTKIVKAIGQHGNPGHSFEIVIDKGDEKEEVFGWDGDGSDRIDLDSIKTFSNHQDDAQLDEAIKHCKDVAVMTACNGCSFDHIQLSNWLNELKILRDRVDNIKPTRKFSFSDGTLDVGEMIGQIMRSISSMHLWHLITNSYAEHKALEDYYTEMPDLIDKFAEDFISNTTEKLEYARFFNTISWIDPTEGPIKYLEQLLSDIANTRAHVAFSDAEKSDLDAVCSLIEGTLYKLKRLDNPRNFILK